jgi:hypothetical protein
MQHQVDADQEGNPIYINLELAGGSLLIKDHDMNLIKKTIGNPSKPSRPSNELFVDINEAYTWFQTTSLSNRLDLVRQQEQNESGE